MHPRRVSPNEKFSLLIDWLWPLDTLKISWPHRNERERVVPYSDRRLDTETMARTPSLDFGAPKNGETDPNW